MGDLLHIERPRAVIEGEHPIPLAALEQHIGIIGRTGSGKSYTARGVVERLLDAGRHRQDRELFHAY